MKNMVKLLGFTALVAVFGFLAGCKQPTDHVHDWGSWQVTDPATCTTGGEETQTCTLDASHKVTRPLAIAPDAHVWSVWDVITPATCTKKGSGTRTCTANPAHDADTGTDNIDIDPNAHDDGEWHVTAATCTATGTRQLRCTRDNAVLDTETIDINPDAHVWNDQKETIPATETTNGIKAITCKHNPSHTKDEESSGEYATGTAGLEFTLISGGANNGTYRVSKNSAWNNTTFPATIHIPAYHRPDANSEYVSVTEISNGTNSNSNNAFGGTDSGSNANTALTAVTFATESQLKSIDGYAFLNCTNLASIDIPDSVTSIGEGAFWECTSLASITIPASVTSIGNFAFIFCSSLASITVADGNTAFVIQDGILYNAAKNTIVAVPGTISGAITIPNGVTSIGWCAFWGCIGLTGITIPESVTTISYGAFASTGLTSISIGEGVTLIGDGAFYDCIGLTAVTIPNSVTSIGTAFTFCPSLQSVTVHATTPPTAETGLFEDTHSSLAIKVPSASVDAYKAAANWSTYADRISAIE